MHLSTHFGTISLKSSIFILPAGVSPIWISMKTTGRVDDDMVSVLGGLNRHYRKGQFCHFHRQPFYSSRSYTQHTQGFNTLGSRRAAANGSSNIGDLQSGV